MAKKSILMLGTVVIVLSLVHESVGSAIPMWEYLSRDEKMSHLYSMFAKQVQQYCKSIQDVHKPQCKRDLLMYGLNKLQSMSDSHIDTMDPWQRGGNDLIWDSMMNGHPMNNNQKKQTTTQSSIQYPEGNYIRNPLFDEAIPSQKPSNSYALDMDLSYDRHDYQEPQNHLQSSTNLNLQYIDSPVMENRPETYLTGPMVVRVHPDGKPVLEDKFKPLPKDDDRDEMTIGRDRLPTMEELTRSGPQFPQPSQSQRYAVMLPPPMMPSPAPIRPQFSFRVNKVRTH